MPENITLPNPSKVIHTPLPNTLQIEDRTGYSLDRALQYLFNAQNPVYVGERRDTSVVYDVRYVWVSFEPNRIRRRAKEEGKEDVLFSNDIPKFEYTLHNCKVNISHINPNIPSKRFSVSIVTWLSLQPFNGRGSS